MMELRYFIQNSFLLSHRSSIMGCDMVVALDQATVNGQKLFGLNWHGPRGPWPVLRRLAGQMHAPGAVIKTRYHELPQARQTYTVLGCGPRGQWGLTNGLNEHQLAMGMASWTSKVAARPGLHGTELVRLTLERSRTACQAQETLTDLIARHGQGQGDAVEERDHIFLIVDPQEALVVEAAGPYWAAIDCRQVRAVSDIALIRQDWRRLAPGLAEHAIKQGWWRDDGSKVDFSGCLAAQPPTHAQALQRWGRATVLLEQQNGHIDAWFLRRVLADHFDSVRRRSPPGKAPPALATTFLTALSAEPDTAAMAWCAFGAPDHAAYFPVLVDGELPALFEESNIVGDGFLRLPASLEKAQRSRDELDKWQGRLDQRVEDFRLQARVLKQQGKHSQLQRQATLFMAQALDDVDAGTASESRLAPAESLAYFAE
jgi:hypothetical protein